MMQNDSITCKNCNQKALFLFNARDYNRYVKNEIYTYYQCSACGFIFLNPIPRNLKTYYPDVFHAIPASLSQLIESSHIEKYKVDLVKKFISSGRLLDIGPSFGGFAYLAKMAGFNVEAIEMDDHCCQFLKQIVGINVFHSTNPSVAMRSVNLYNVITLWHVIEHLPDPWPTVESAARHLLPGGIIVIASPNPDSLSFNAWGRFWVHVDAPRHVQLIPISLLKDKLRTFGLRPIFLTSKDPGASSLNRQGWQKSAMNLFANKKLKHLMQILGFFAYITMIPLDYSGFRGNGYVAVFKKT